MEAIELLVTLEARQGKAADRRGISKVSSGTRAR